MKLGIIAAMLVLCSSAFAQKTAHVYAERITPDLPEYKTMVKVLQDRTIKAQKELRGLDSLMKLRYQECSKADISEAELGFCQQDLQDLQDRIQTRNSKLEQEIQQYQQTEQERILKKIQDAIRKVGEAGAYTYVMEAGNMYYINGGDDLTDAVRQELGLGTYAEQ